MSLDATITCLPIGKQWEPAVREQLERVISNLPDGIKLVDLEPAYDEMEVLGRLANIAESKPALLLLAALHGGSARQIVLAGSKSNLPVVIWCHDEKHSLASSALAAEGLRQLGHPYILIHGDCQDELSAAIRAAAAKQRLAEARIGKLGLTHFNLIGTEINPVTLQRRFGCWVMPLYSYELRERISKIDAHRIAADIETLESHCKVSVDESVLERTVAMRAVLAEMAKEYRLDAIAIDCWNEIIPEFGVSPCLGFADGKIIIACEGDIGLAATQIAGEAISQRLGYVGDFYSFDENTGEAILKHCGGFASLHGLAEPLEIASLTLPDASGSARTIATCWPILPEGNATILIIHGEQLDRLHISRCKIRQTDFSERMNVHVRIEANAAQFRRKLAGNHYVVFPGDAVEAWTLWASWSGITVEGD